jgi:Uma2 family endonuclease
MATVQVRVGPEEHGTPISDWDFEAADFVPGYRYELIDGRVYVSSEPDPPENALENWLVDALKAYSRQRPDVVCTVTTKARVYVPGRRRVTIPEPDLACYNDMTREQMLRGALWHEYSPILVAEVLVAGDPVKDLERNVELYFRVPKIGEYWVLDGRENPLEPVVIRHRRRKEAWAVSTVPFGSKLTTPLLPGFALVLDPRK